MENSRASKSTSNEPTTVVSDALPSPASISTSENADRLKRLPKPDPKRKRPFPFKRKQQTNGKRSKASFDKSEVAKHMSYTSPILTAYELETSFRGIIDLCSILFSILTNRDNKIANLLTKEHFIYVTLLSAIYRCNLTASKSTTTIIRGLSYLKETVNDLLLPDVLCQFIETFGFTKLSSGITLIPFMRCYTVMKDTLDFLDPSAILRRMNREPVNTDWSIDDAVILEYKRAISRFLKNAIALRKVNNEELEAKPEFIASYRFLDDGRIQPLSFELMDVTQCTLGAVYQFRDADGVSDWNGSIFPPIVHEAKPVSVNNYITDHILHSLQDK